MRPSLVIRREPLLALSDASELRPGLESGHPILQFLRVHGQDYEGAYRAATGLELVAVLVALGASTREVLRRPAGTSFDRAVRNALPFDALPVVVAASRHDSPPVPVVELCSECGILDGIASLSRELVRYGTDYRRAYDSSSGVSLVAVITALGGDATRLRGISGRSSSDDAVTDEELRARFPFEQLPVIRMERDSR